MPEMEDDLTHDLESVRIIHREMIGDTTELGVKVRAAELFGGNVFTGGGPHQRWTCEENSSRLVDDDRLIAHRRDIGPAGGAHPHDC